MYTSSPSDEEELLLIFAVCENKPKRKWVHELMKKEKIKEKSIDFVLNLIRLKTAFTHILD